MLNSDRTFIRFSLQKPDVSLYRHHNKLTAKRSYLAPGAPALQKLERHPDQHGGPGPGGGGARQDGELVHGLLVEEGHKDVRDTDTGQ